MMRHRFRLQRRRFGVQPACAPTTFRGRRADGFHPGTGRASRRTEKSAPLSRIRKKCGIALPTAPWSTAKVPHAAHTVFRGVLRGISRQRKGAPKMEAEPRRTNPVRSRIRKKCGCSTSRGSRRTRKVPHAAQQVFRRVSEDRSKRTEEGAFRRVRTSRRAPRSFPKPHEGRPSACPDGTTERHVRIGNVPSLLDGIRQILFRRFAKQIPMKSDATARRAGAASGGTAKGRKKSRRITKVVATAMVPEAS